MAVKNKESFRGSRELAEVEECIGPQARAGEMPAGAFTWPKISDLRLSPGLVSFRSDGIGGSDANVLLSGHPEKIRRLWQEKRGEREPEDLSASLPVALGCWTEEFNRQWYEKLTGQAILDVGAALTCAKYGWRRCLLDGRIAQSNSIWEAKHCNGFSSPDELLERYMPQLQHNMAVAKADTAVLSVILGNHKFEIIEVAADWLYQLELVEAEADFWECVQSGREPVPAIPPAPPKPIGVREVCFEGNNAWASAAADWLENREAAKLHASACRTIKELVEEDVARSFGHGIEAKRSRSGAISIRELRP